MNMSNELVHVNPFPGLFEDVDYYCSSTQSDIMLVNFDTRTLIFHFCVPLFINAVE